MATRRVPLLLSLVVLGAGAVLLLVAGVFTYASLTATALHPDPAQVPSTTETTASAKWARAAEQAHQMALDGLTEQNLPGLSAAAAIGPELVWAEALGYADLELRTPVKPHMRFRVGDASMALTSAAAGLLIEQRKLSLDDEIQKYVPAFPKKASPVTIRHLMAQQSGIRGDAGDEESLEHCDRTLDALDRFAKDDLRFDPGTRYSRSTYGWILVSGAIEAAANNSFFTYMRAQIFDPLGMADTTTDSSVEQMSDRVTFYHPRFAGDPRYGPEPAREGDYSCLAGAGAFLSTPSDLVRFGMAITNGALLQPATVAMLQTRQKLASGEATDYGLGWMLDTVPAGRETLRVAGHGTKPDFLGTTAALVTLPDRGIVVAVMTNESFGSVWSLATKIAAVFASAAPR